MLVQSANFGLYSSVVNPTKELISKHYISLVGFGGECKSILKEVAGGIYRADKCSSHYPAYSHLRYSIESRIETAEMTVWFEVRSV